MMTETGDDGLERIQSRIHNSYELVTIHQDNMMY